VPCPQGEADMCYPAEDIEALAQHFTGSKDLRLRIEPGPSLSSLLSLARSSC